jgi:hypothetical protein
MSDEPVKEKITIDGKEFELFSFTVPMFHEDWHKAEEMFLEFVKYEHNGPDYWDDFMTFCHIEDVEIVKPYMNRSPGWGL